jgi:hypothetical protein
VPGSALVDVPAMREKDREQLCRGDFGDNYWSKGGHRSILLGQEIMGGYSGVVRHRGLEGSGN